MATVSPPPVASQNVLVQLQNQYPATRGRPACGGEHCRPFFLQSAVQIEHVNLRNLVMCRFNFKQLLVSFIEKRGYRAFAWDYFQWRKNPVPD